MTDIKVRAYKFSLEIIQIIKRLNNKHFVYSILLKQLTRSATSVGANLIEGKAACSKKDFIKFYTISLKSANETKYWLALLRDTKILGKEESQKLLEEIEEISKIIATIIINTKKNMK